MTPIVPTCLDGSHVCDRGWDLRDAANNRTQLLRQADNLAKAVSCICPNSAADRRLMLGVQRYRQEERG